MWPFLMFPNVLHAYSPQYMRILYLLFSAISALLGQQFSTGLISAVRCLSVSTASHLFSKRRSGSKKGNVENTIVEVVLVGCEVSINRFAKLILQKFKILYLVFCCIVGFPPIPICFDHQLLGCVTTTHQQSKDLTESI